MTKIQIIPGNFTITDPDWPVFDFVPTDGIYTSDSFSQDGPLVGAYTDAALGGMAQQWITTGDGGWNKEGGVARSIGIGIAGFQPPSADYKTSIKLLEFPNLSANLTISNRRSSLAFSSGTEYVEARIAPAGSITLVARENATTNTIGTATGASALGDTVELATFGTLAEVIVNGEVVLSGETSVAGAGYAVVRTSYEGADPRVGAISDYILSTER